MTGGLYTWSSNQSPPKFENLDRVLMSSSSENIFSLVTVRKIVRELSDHNILLLDTMSDGTLKAKMSLDLILLGLKVKILFLLCRDCGINIRLALILLTLLISS